MNRLRDEAVKGLRGANTSALIMFLMFGFAFAASALNDFSKYDTGTALSRFSWIAISVGCGYVIGKFKKKKDDMPFDERETFLLKEAIKRSNSTLVIYYFLFALITFIFGGLNGTLPIWLLLLVMLFGFWLSQVVISFYLLKHTREDDENSQGDAA